MKSLALTVKAVVDSRSDVGALLGAPGDAVIIRRGQPRWMMLKCPCGCGDEIPINLDRRAGKAWRYYEDRHRGATLYPSVWRDTGCQSHFIVWGGRILLLEDIGVDETAPVPGLSELLQKVRIAWPSDQMVSYADVADTLGAIPWDVLEACRSLARQRFLVEGLGDQQTMFRRR